MHKEPNDPDVKVRLLQAAKRLFATQGYDGTSVRQICEAAGANVALVSYYFGGKENMFQALFETYFPNQEMEAYLLQHYEPVEGIREIIRGVTMFRLKEPEMIALLQQEIALNSPRIALIQDHAFPVWRQLRDLLRDGREQGLFRFRSLNSTFMSVIGVMLFHKQTYYFAPLLEQEPDNLDTFIEDLFEFVMRGLCYDAGSIS
ncbi:TetR family transcriptional regulator [Paenibacillus spongiae]|uniref:TetR family transcriptional regulator n=1 Tax=Paenibacillus spongiae TaxID=2909671 RepID=A0ABY5SF55_9BACL|nr:TetR family transcriptional regulator [Paenibacillus spongiae]UVI31308.1 TetR family transcriptional regulator [Paenibacillus spongiae]